MNILSSENEKIRDNETVKGKLTIIRKIPKDMKIKKGKMKETSKIELTKQVLDNQRPRERRKTIFELDSYYTILKPRKISFSEENVEINKEKMQIAGKVRINLSPLTQRIVSCVIGENLTEEYPWLTVDKQIIQDNIYLHPDSSEFLPVLYEISCFQDNKIFIGYDPQIKLNTQFFICVTEEARDEVIREIQTTKLKHENQVRNTINKTPNLWKHLGSSDDIESNTHESLKSSISASKRVLLKKKCQLNLEFPRRNAIFSFRKVKDKRDGYVEVTPSYLDTYENIKKLLIDLSVQNTSKIRHIGTQTTYKSVDCASRWVSCEELLQYETDEEIVVKDMKKILKDLENLNMILNQENRYWDIYTDDYEILIQ